MQDNALASQINTDFLSETIHCVDQINPLTIGLGSCCCSCSCSAAVFVADNN